jgi:hypothetical protein
MSVTLDRVPDHCVLHSPVFTRLGEGTFRRAETDGAPVMVVPLGDGFASLPLRSLQREFGIEDDSPDGRMLALIAESLEFVSSLMIGDPLPSEVLNGKASWEPTAKHQATAAAKLRLQLIDWLDPSLVANESELPSLERMESDPKLRASVQKAFERAAEELKLPNVQAVAQLVSEIAGELAYIEALRDRFLRRVQSMVVRIDAIAAGVVSQDRKMLLARISRLAHLALDQIAGRFILVDGQTREVLSTLRNASAHRSFIRSHRDWLFKSSRGWEPILVEWDASAMPGLDDATWARLNRTYHFLAPRFMPVQEWFSADMQALGRKKKLNAQTTMVW